MVFPAVHRRREPRLARGGPAYATSPTRATLGEAGPRPLSSDTRTWQSGGVARTGGPTDAETISVPVAIALGSTMTGGLVLAWLWAFDHVPAVVAVTASLLWVAGGLLFAAVAARRARREGDSIGETVGRGCKALWRWLWAFFP